MAETSKCLLVLGDDEWLYFPVISEQGEDKVQTFGGGPVTRWEKLCDVGNKFDIVFDGTDMYCVAKDMSVEVQRFGPTVRPGGWTPHARGRVCSITLHQKYVYGTGAPGGLMDRVRGGPVYVWTYVGDGLEEATWERACTGQCKALATKGGLLLGLGNEGWIYGQPVEGLTRESKWNKMFNLGPCAESFVVLDDGLICKIEGGCLYYGYPRRDIAQEIDWRNAPRDGLQCTLRRVLVAPDVANFWEIARAQKELEVAAKDQARQEAAVMARSAPRREERNRVAEILHNNALGVATVLDRRDDDFDFSSAPDAAQASREHSGAAPSLPQASREPEPAPASTQQPIRAIDSESDRRVPGQPAASDPLPPALCQPSAPDTLPPALRQPDVANTSLGGPCESDAAERFPRAPHEPQAAALPPQALHETYVESTFPQASREPVAAAPLQGHSCTPAAAVPYPPQSPEQDALSSSQRFPCEPSAAAPYATGSREVEAAAPSFRGPCAPAAADGAPQPPAPTPPPFAAEPAILQAPCASVHPPLASQTPLAAEQLQGQSEQRFVGGVTHSVDSAVASSAVPGQFGAFVGENASAAQRQQEQVTHNTHPVAAAASRVSFPAGAHPGPGVTASPGPPFGADQPQEPFPTGALVEAHSLSTAALNGLQGRVVGPQGERYRIDFAGETGERALKPANLQLIEEEPFPTGALVEAHSLSAAALNGLQGRVLGPQGERYRIHFVGATGEKALKPANLKLIEEDELSSSQWFPGEPTAAAPNASGSREVEAAEASLRMPCAPAVADGAPPQPPPFAAEQAETAASEEMSRTEEIAQVGSRRTPSTAEMAATYVGTVKSFNEETGFGFISCEATFQMFQRDVFLHHKQMQAAVGVTVGDRVGFALELNGKGQPQARQVCKLGTAEIGESNGGANSAAPADPAMARPAGDDGESSHMGTQAQQPSGQTAARVVGFAPTEHTPKTPPGIWQTRPGQAVQSSLHGGPTGCAAASSATAKSASQPRKFMPKTPPGTPPGPPPGKASQTSIDHPLTCPIDSLWKNLPQPLSSALPNHPNTSPPRRTPPGTPSCSRSPRATNGSDGAQYNAASAGPSLDPMPQACPSAPTPADESALPPDHQAAILLPDAEDRLAMGGRCSADGAPPYEEEVSPARRAQCDGLDAVREDGTAPAAICAGMTLEIKSPFLLPMKAGGSLDTGYLDVLRVGEKVQVLHVGTLATGDEDWLFGRRLGTDGEPGWFPLESVQ